MASQKNFRTDLVPCVALLAAMFVSDVSQAQLYLKRTRDVRVSPVDEITVIDPGTSSEAKPDPLVKSRQVEIPPALLVHNFYYTGDRDFRGNVFPGGPSVVVVEHPKTGVRLYIDVQMLPGSPRVVYRENYIDYHFGKQKIRIQFCNPLNPLHYRHPTVKYCRGNERIQAGGPTESGLSRWIHRTGLPEAVSSASESTRGIVNRSADGIKTTAQVVTTPVRLVTQSTMLGSLLTPDPETDAARSRDAAVTKAAGELANRDLSIPTLR